MQINDSACVCVRVSLSNSLVLYRLTLWKQDPLFSITIQIIISCCIYFAKFKFIFKVGHFNLFIYKLWTLLRQITCVFFSYLLSSSLPQYLVDFYCSRLSVPFFERINIYKFNFFEKKYCKYSIRREQNSLISSPSISNSAYFNWNIYVNICLLRTLLMEVFLLYIAIQSGGL